jgi:hypothetical protein
MFVGVNPAFHFISKGQHFAWTQHVGGARFSQLSYFAKFSRFSLSAGPTAFDATYKALYCCSRANELLLKQTPADLSRTLCYCPG